MGRETHKLRVLTHKFNRRETIRMYSVCNHIFMNNYVILGLTHILLKRYYSALFITDVKPIASLMYTSGTATLILTLRP